MNNVFLGKTLKAMYKLSGKTLQQLADETGLTLDTLNNVFYARLQKPGFFGIKCLVEATGYTVADLVGFLEHGKDLPEDADVTDEFTKYLFSVREPALPAESAVTCAKSAKADAPNCSCCNQIAALNEAHEKQLDRFRETHLHYVDALHARYQAQLEQTEEDFATLKTHYERSLDVIREERGREHEEMTRELRRMQNLNRFLTAALAVLAIVAGVLIFLAK